MTRGASAAPCHTAGMALLERQDALGHPSRRARPGRRGPRVGRAGDRRGGHRQDTLVADGSSHERDRGRPGARPGRAMRLTTPRALGPLRDIAWWSAVSCSTSSRPKPRRSSCSRPRSGCCGTRATTTLVVIEDVHHADDATVDMLAFLSRRMATMPTVLVVTYRDDEVGPTHPLQVFLGMTASVGARRVELQPLSPDAVARSRPRAGDRRRRGAAPDHRRQSVLRHRDRRGRRTRPAADRTRRGARPGWSAAAIRSKGAGRGGGRAEPGRAVAARCARRVRTATPSTTASAAACSRWTATCCGSGTSWRVCRSRPRCRRLAGESSTGGRSRPLAHGGPDEQTPRGSLTTR